MNILVGFWEILDLVDEIFGGHVSICFVYGELITIGVTVRLCQCTFRRVSRNLDASEMVLQAGFQLSNMFKQDSLVLMSIHFFHRLVGRSLQSKRICQKVSNIS